jgi:uncharacterized protein involved in copper resistance
LQQVRHNSAATIGKLADSATPGLKGYEISVRLQIKLARRLAPVVGMGYRCAEAMVGWFSSGMASANGRQSNSGHTLLAGYSVPTL